MQPAEVDDVECGQKAPSAKRCIKTNNTRTPKANDLKASESTERQKVH